MECMGTRYFENRETLLKWGWREIVVPWPGGWDATENECDDWCQKNLRHGYSVRMYHNKEITAFIQDPQDAVLFILRWS